MSEEKFPEPLEEVYLAERILLESNYHYWIEHVLFTFNWWFLLALTIVPWIIWFRLVDRNRLLEISFIGAIVATTAIILDTIGTSLQLWSYGYKLVQMISPLYPIDLSLLPVLFMLLYQWFTTWKAYIISQTILAALGSFVAEPLFIWLGIYILHEWEIYYSFPIYIALAIIFKGLVEKLKANQAYDK
ncbi:CBO0543 family protein [Halobacillus seohaensis]|uniref:CBO0543 family protein n=1 Tax=Halobacillus seohaensis TaxID=447421 RepID=A0ABW2EM06_9BACI